MAKKTRVARVVVESGSPRELADFAHERLTELADPVRAVPMAAYMRNRATFYGVAKTQVAAIEREARKLFPCGDRETYVANVRALWALPNREARYLAVGYARQKAWIGNESLGLYEGLIREGAWWDLVDETAAHLVGGALGRDRRRVEPVMDRWVSDADMWIRRTAVLSQLRLGAAANREQLFRYCLKLAGEREFFIRKAIGWALREYSKTAPEAVAEFLETNRERLSPLSLREGAKVLVRAWRLGKGFEKLG
jgi:3-methyladenine DNA glycosylase AlkD